LFGYVKRKDRSDHARVGGRIILKYVLGTQRWRAWIGFIWLRIGTDGGLL
jgi:hypothetical protein